MEKGASDNLGPESIRNVCAIVRSESHVYSIGNPQEEHSVKMVLGDPLYHHREINYLLEIVQRILTQ